MSKLVVKKFSSALVTNREGIDHTAIKSYVAGMADSYYWGGDGLIIITSGAKVAGRARAEAVYGREAAKKMTSQQLSTIGATAIFNAWEAAFEGQGILSASVAVTHRQLAGRSLWGRLSNRREKSVFTEMIHNNIASGVPVNINESDGTSIAELFKENDGLGCHVAIAADADEYQMFTKNGGLVDEDGQLVGEINPDNIDWARGLVASRDISATGTGGFLAKIEAGWEAAQAGIATSIAAPNEDMTGQQVTRFVVG
jgi:glutamate 5-kinase